jgi:hypothetical protein
MCKPKASEAAKSQSSFSTLYDYCDLFKRYILSQPYHQNHQQNQLQVLKLFSIEEEYKKLIDNMEKT